jgi:hypothetical protein
MSRNTSAWTVGAGNTLCMPTSGPTCQGIEHRATTNIHTHTTSTSSVFMWLLSMLEDDVKQDSENDVKQDSDSVTGPIPKFKSVDGKTVPLQKFKPVDGKTVTFVSGLRTTQSWKIVQRDTDIKIK